MALALSFSRGVEFLVGQGGMGNFRRNIDNLPG